MNAGSVFGIVVVDSTSTSYTNKHPQQTRTSTRLTISQQRGDATTVSNQPAGATYSAVLPKNKYGVEGGVKATQGKDGNGVHFDVEFSNLPKEGGPFSTYTPQSKEKHMLITTVYHIHVLPVDASGNCSSTLAHLDPFIRGEEPKCDPSAPETCQTGDLSGKHGEVTADPFVASYDDAFNSLVS